MTYNRETHKIIGLDKGYQFATGETIEEAIGTLQRMLAKSKELEAVGTWVETEYDGNVTITAAIPKTPQDIELDKIRETIKAKKDTEYELRQLAMLKAKYEKA